LHQLRLEIGMSALGQERTYAPQKAMSALPPKATAKADFRVVLTAPGAWAGRGSRWRPRPQAGWSRTQLRTWSTRQKG